PSMLFSGAIIFTVAALTRNMIATYLGAVSIYIVYMVIAAAGGSPMFVNNTPPSTDAFALAATFDPFAITTFLQQTDYWTALEQNQQLLALEGPFLLNRLIIVALGLLVLAVLHYSFVLKMPKQKKSKGREVKVSDTKYQYKVVSQVSGGVANRAAWWSSLKLELELVVASKPFIAMIAIWSALILMELVNAIANIGFGPQDLPTTTVLLSAFQFDTLPRFGMIFIIYYSAEIFWRDRNVNINAFIDSMPVTNPVLFSTKLLALLTVPFMMILASIVMSMLFQLAKGYGNLEPALYLSVFVYTGLPLVCVAVLALFMQSMSKNKYMGMALTAAVMLSTSGVVSGALGLNHPMFHFATMPVLNYTAMNGYADSNDGFTWYMLYWGSLCALFGVICYLIWPRGAEFGLRRRFKQIKNAPNATAAKIAMLACTVVLLASAGKIFYQTNVVNDYLTRDESLLRRADYEKAYKQYENLPTPQVTALKLDAEFYPAQRGYSIKAEYVLTNRTEQLIERLMVSPSWGDVKVDVSVKSAKSTDYNERFKTYWFDLAQPLSPGQSVTMDVTYKMQQSGFEPTSFRNNMIQNGAYLVLNTLAPRYGYRAGMEIGNPSDREDYQLPPKGVRETQVQAISRTGGDFSSEYDWIDFDATISTAIDQTAISQGNLVKQWQENNRQYFHYKSEKPIRNMISLQSGRYEVKKVQQGDVSIELYYHKTHGQNVDHMLRAAKDALAYFSANFSKYPFNHLRITEVPASRENRATGFASPGHILMTNHAGILADLDSNYAVDQLYRRITHEVAHQWWGYQLDPAMIQGNLVMVETLAKYSEMQIMNKHLGKAQVRDLVQFEARRYLRGRTMENDEEMPLYLAKGNQNHILYSKGNNVMYQLNHLLGEQKMNEMMASLLSQYAYPAKPPTSLDLLNLFYGATPKAIHGQIDELMKAIIVYDLSIEEATVTKLDDGRYKVDVHVKGLKNSFSGKG
ncbi:MAG: hypothetical protein HRT35_35035, partial [Algicola sp.]|nr:hypothetical protein [Algicola sp.]